MLISPTWSIFFRWPRCRDAFQWCQDTQPGMQISWRGLERKYYDQQTSHLDDSCDAETTLMGWIPIKIFRLDTSFQQILMSKYCWSRYQIPSGTKVYRMHLPYLNYERCQRPENLEKMIHKYDGISPPNLFVPGWCLNIPVGMKSTNCCHNLEKYCHIHKHSVSKEAYGWYQTFYQHNHRNACKQKVKLQRRRAGLRNCSPD